MTEGLLLALVGGAIGVGLAVAAIRTLLAVNPDALPRTANIALDWRVLGFTLALAIATGVLFGLAPLTSVSRRLSAALRDGTRTTGGRLQKLVRSTLVVAEVTFAVMLVVGAGLLVRSFVNLMRVDLGFDRSHLVTFGVVKPMFPMSTPETRIAQRVRVVEFFDQLQGRLAALPGVQGVTDMSGLPPNRSVDANDTDFEWIPDMADPNPKAPKYPPQNVDYWQYVGRDYATTMGIPVLEGRAFRAGDEGGPPVVLVNQTLATKYFRNFGRDPVGERIKPGFGKEIPWFTIVGVLKDVKQGGVDAPTGTEIYLLQSQMIQLGVNGNMNVALRTTQSASALAGPIRAALHDLDPTLPIVKLQSMDEVVDTAVARPRFIVVLLGLFAALALALAAVGTYGVLSYLVTRQQQEIGIRMALGAGQAEILSHFLIGGLKLAGVGLVIGVVGSLVVTRLIQSLLFNVAPTDPATFAGVVIVIALVAIAACLVPAWRATRVDPLTVLRESRDGWARRGRAPAEPQSADVQGARCACPNQAKSGPRSVVHRRRVAGGRPSPLDRHGIFQGKAQLRVRRDADVFLASGGRRARSGRGADDPADCCALAPAGDRAHDRADARTAADDLHVSLLVCGRHSGLGRCRDRVVLSVQVEPVERHAEDGAALQSTGGIGRGDMARESRAGRQHRLAVKHDRIGERGLECVAGPCVRRRQRMAEVHGHGRARGHVDFTSGDAARREHHGENDDQAARDELHHTPPGIYRVGKQDASADSRQRGGDSRVRVVDPDTTGKVSLQNSTLNCTCRTRGVTKCVPANVERKL